VYRRSVCRSVCPLLAWINCSRDKIIKKDTDINRLLYFQEAGWIFDQTRCHTNAFSKQRRPLRPAAAPWADLFTTRRVTRCTCGDHTPRSECLLISSIQPFSLEANTQTATATLPGVHSAHTQPTTTTHTTQPLLSVEYSTRRTVRCCSYCTHHHQQAHHSEPASNTICGVNQADFDGVHPRVTREWHREWHRQTSGVSNIVISGVTLRWPHFWCRKKSGVCVFNSAMLCSDMTFWDNQL